MPMNSPTPIWPRRNRSRVMITPVKPATRVPSRSKKAPTLGPARADLRSRRPIRATAWRGLPRRVVWLSAEVIGRCSRSVMADWARSVSGAERRGDGTPFAAEREHFVESRLAGTGRRSRRR